MRVTEAGFRALGWGRVATMLLATVVSSATAGTWVPVTPDGKMGAGVSVPPQAPQVIVDWHNDSGLAVRVAVAGLELSPHTTKEGTFVTVGCPETPLAGAVGTPALPVVRELLLVPPGATIRMEVDEGRSRIIDLPAAGFAGRVMPAQAPIRMVPGAREAAPFCYEEAAYAAKGRLPSDRVAITEAGMVRGRRVCLLEVRSVAYDAVGGVLTVWPNMRVTLRFHGARGGVGGLGPVGPLNGVLLNPQPTGPVSRDSGNYLIVVPEDYASSAPITQLAGARTARGLDVTTYSVPSGTTRDTIKAYIDGWYTPTEACSILLVGDSLGTQTTSTSTMIPTWFGGGASEAGTDLPYACMDGEDDWYPDAAIGRFSVRQVSELQDIVDKTLFVEAGVFPDPDYVRRAAFLAGTDVNSGDEATHNAVIDTHLEPLGYECHKLYERSYGATTQDVHDAFNAGCVHVAFYGHSYDDQWMSGPEFSHADVQNMANTGKYPFVLSFTCWVGAWWSSTDPWYIERWHRVPEKGCAAIIAADENVYVINPGWPETSNLEKFFFDSIYLDDLRQISPAWQAALYRLLAMYGPDEPVTRDYFEMYNLLGDPALRIPMQDGFTLRADPSGQDLCAPPVQEAVYTVEIGKDGDFTEPITLTVDGAPSGTTVGFSTNGVPPPFTAVMTIGDVDSAAPGDYSLEIIATSTSAQRSRFVQLGLSNSIPPTVTLTDPPNGALNVSLTPTLVWQPSAQALDYEVELATDSEFNSVVYHAIITDTTVAPDVELSQDTQYHWHVRAINGCGDSGFGSPFSFTTLLVFDHFTEHFEYGFDLDNFGIRLVPDGSHDFYAICGEPITVLPTDPAGGVPLTLSDDGSVLVSPGSPVLLYDVSYSTFYVNANGHLTFTTPDGTADESLEAHFAIPRVSALFDDLDPSAGGTVSWKETTDRVAVTWEGVPELGPTGSNTFQIELLFDGEIHVSWLDVDSDDSIVGPSEGSGVPGAYIESDISAAGSCPGDLDEDGDVDLDDYAVFAACMNGPDNPTPPPGCEAKDFAAADIGDDNDVDLADFEVFQKQFMSP